MGITRLFEISKSSFRSLDAAMNVTGQNIANAETEGYVRRRVSLNAIDASSNGLFTGRTGSDPSGTGVAISGYERLRDSLLEHARTEQRSSLAFANEQERIMSAVEALFPTGVGSLDDSLEKFWNGWADLADHPTDMGVRSTLRERGRTVVDRMQELGRQVGRIMDDTRAALTESVDESNRLLNRIHDLNVQIGYATNSGNPDFAAEDARDVAIRRLAEYIPVQLTENPDHSTNVYLDGISVITTGSVTELVLDTSGATPSLTIGDTGIEFRADSSSGAIGGQIRAMATDLPALETDLNAIAAAIVAEVNAIHAAGYGADGSTGLNFFDPAGVTSRSIGLSSDVETSINAIAASGDAAAAGDNAIALAIYELRDEKTMGGATRSIGDFTIDMVAGVGATVEAARHRAAGAESALTGLDAMAQGISGVSIDEEMINLIRLQQAFGAAARVLQTAKDMFDTLIRM